MREQDDPESVTATRGARMVDVARLAGVSQQTVSRVVNGHSNVTADIRERVDRAIAQLRYRRNPAARALATSRTMNLGVVSFGLAQYGPSVALTGIIEEARRAGYATNLVTLGEVDRSAMRTALDHLVAEAVDGIVFLAPVAAAIEALHGLDTGVPFVVFEPGAEGSPTRVVTDDASGARLATRHLLDLGHDTVWHVAGPQGWLGSAARIRGWSQELSYAERVTNKALVGNWTSQSGYEAGLTIAANPAITAVFAANDQMALGVLKALTECGLRVPEDISVVGFDDVPESRFFQPSLTTIRIDFEEVGRLAVDSILKLMRAEDLDLIPAIAPILVVRSSSGPPPILPRRARMPNAEVAPNTHTTPTKRK
jgi:DNA-binding LacI/PurR family transcriptional regulator